MKLGLGNVREKVAQQNRAGAVFSRAKISLARPGGGVAVGETERDAR
jgi:hypothetical protein